MGLFNLADIRGKKAAGSFNYVDCGTVIVEVQGTSYAKSPNDGQEYWAIESKILEVVEVWVGVVDKSVPKKDQLNETTFCATDSPYAIAAREDDALKVIPCTMRVGQVYSDLVRKNSMLEPTVKACLMGMLNITEEELDKEFDEDGEALLDAIGINGDDKQAEHENPLEGAIVHMHCFGKITREKGNMFKKKTYRPLTNEECVEYGIELDEE